jgi:hypothetical protein
MHTYIHTYMHTYIHTHTHIYQHRASLEAAILLTALYLDTNCVRFLTTWFIFCSLNRTAYVTVCSHTRVLVRKAFVLLLVLSSLIMAQMRRNAFKVPDTVYVACC